MKRLASSDSLGALMSICPDSTDEGNNNNNNNSMYATRDFQTMMDGYDDMDQESCGQLLGSEKKRRLSVDQVKALEKNFEVENKLEPERKLKLAQELALQPRQVAVWFQNRRARWKTKTLERDYALLKADYDALNLDFDKLRRDNQALLAQIREMKSKAPDENNLNESEQKDDDKQLEGEEDEAAATTGIKIKDPSSSDSCDSSAILNEDVNQLGGGGGININNVGNNDFQQFVKIEEHNFFGEESCSTLFSDDQAPSLHWYEWS